MSKPDFKEFSLLAILQDQTEVVQFIIQHEKKVEPDECFFNQFDIKVRLSIGTKSMPSQHYYNTVNRLGVMHRTLLSRMEELEKENEDTSGIEAEIDFINSLLLEYDDVVYAERNIYEWKLIPFWLSEMLVQKGETVFRHMGNNWWGIKELIFTGILNHKILAELYSEL